MSPRGQLVIEEYLYVKAQCFQTNWIERCSSLKKNSPLLDIGCGNGLLLVELAKSGFTHLVGVDYCESKNVLEDLTLFCVLIFTAFSA